MEYVFLGGKSHNSGAVDPGESGCEHKSQCPDHIKEGGPENGNGHKGQKNAGKTHYAVGKEHDRLIDDAAVVARGHAQ